MQIKIAMFSRFPREIAKPRGGVESATVNLALALVKNPDVDLHIITLEKSLKVLSCSTMNGMTIHRLPDTFPYQAIDILIGSGKRKVCKYIEELNPDIAHFHESYAYGMENLRVPMVFTVHGPDTIMIPVESGKIGRMKSIRLPLWNYIENRGYQHISNIITISPFIQSYLEQRSQARMFPVANAINERFFELERQEDKRVLFSAGWVSSRKNTLGLIRSFANYVEEYGDSETELRIAGDLKRDVEYVAIVNEYVEKHNLSDRVNLLGTLDQAQMTCELTKASTFILTSFQEVAPMVIAESMAAAIPVICSNKCGMPYMVDDKASGLLVDPEDEDSIKCAMNELLSNESKRKNFGAKGRKLAIERFSPEVVAEKTLSVYAQILNSA